MPPALLEKYFDGGDGQYAFRKDLRRQIIFGRHDLIQDAPISRVDLLVCRNTLMYFNAETQARILQRFQFALNDHGMLFLGRAETLMTHTSTFAPIDLKRRISEKVSDAGREHSRSAAVAACSSRRCPSRPTITRAGCAKSRSMASRRRSSSSTRPARWSSPTNARGRCLAFLATTSARPLQDLKISYRPVELRSAIDQVYAERRPVIMRASRVAVAGRRRCAGSTCTSFRSSTDSAASCSAPASRSPT